MAFCCSDNRKKERNKMAITQAKMVISATKTGGSSVFSGLGTITGVGADFHAARQSCAEQIQAQIASDSENAALKQEVLDGLNGL